MVEESRTSMIYIYTHTHTYIYIYIYIYMYTYSNAEVLMSNTEVLQGENAKSFVEESRTSNIYIYIHVVMRKC